MRRILFQWRGLTVWSYPALLYFGLTAAVAAGNLAAHSAHAPAGKVFIATLILIAPAIAGARLLYVAEHWKEFRTRPASIWNVREGGMSMYGAMPAMLLLSVPLLRVLGMDAAQFWDVTAPAILTGIAVTKIGCLLNGCCAGRSCAGRLGLVLANSRGIRERRVPVQLLEASWALAVLVPACRFLGRTPFPGALFLAVCAVYGVGRLGLECLREGDPGSPRVRLGHACSAAAALGAAGTLLLHWPH